MGDANPLAVSWSDTGDRLRNAAEATLHDAPHHFAEDRHGSGVDDGVDAGTGGRHPERPYSGRVVGRRNHHDAHEERSETEQERHQDNNQSLGESDLLAING